MANHLHDTHFHLDLFKPVNEILNEIETNKVYTIAVTNLPVLFKKLNEQITSKYIRPALGFHPELLLQYKHHIPQMWELLPETRYIGEVGLDFKTGKDFKELQVSFFTELIDRCNQLEGKIVTIHSRQSADVVTSIIGGNFKGKIILHWYSGTKSTLKQAIGNGYFFSINYSMVNSKNGINIIKEIPIDRILLETDAPFIKFNNEPFRPTDIPKIISRLADILEMNYEQINSILWSNFNALIK
ncbi:MAG: TatD family hydrolase [Carboxylicivirga sp.]|jgi:TatD DNase family protein|nr:TatD family hydrolase [Carboxylicivirga sp.]